MIILIAAKSKNKNAIARIRNFLLEYNNVRINMRGSHLENLGLEPSPRFRHVLDKTLYAKIDGDVKSKKDEIDLAKKLIGRFKKL